MQYFKSYQIDSWAPFTWIQYSAEPRCIFFLLRSLKPVGFG